MDNAHAPQPFGRPRAAKQLVRKLLDNRWFRLGVVVGIIALVTAGIAIQPSHINNPVPKNIRSSVPYTVYYPDPQKLPPGFSLVANSFRSPQAGVIVFTVAYGHGQNLVFSEQPMASSATLLEFINHYIPLHTTFNTPLGSAQLGAYNNNGALRSVVNLPIIHGPWIIVTAPANINQFDLKQVIVALTS